MSIIIILSSLRITLSCLNPFSSRGEGPVLAPVLPQIENVVPEWLARVAADHSQGEGQEGDTEYGSVMGESEV